MKKNPKRTLLTLVILLAFVIAGAIQKPASARASADDFCLTGWQHNGVSGIHSGENGCIVFTSEYYCDWTGETATCSQTYCEGGPGMVTDCPGMHQ